MERHLFAGGNCENGFTNLYENVINRVNAEAFYIIKGGSGIGKSTMLKKIAKEVGENNVEYFHCSSDINSFDGLKLINKNIAFVDGTSPHVIEPIYVGLTDNVIDLSIAIDKKVLKGKKQELNDIIKEKKNYFNKAYSVINAISSIRNEIIKEINNNIDFKKAERIVNELLKEIGNNSEENSRKLFCGALTAEGECYLESKYENEKVIILRGEKEISSVVLNKVYKKLTEQNKFSEVFYSPFSVNSIYALKVGKVIVTVNDKDKGKIMFLDTDSVSSCDKQLLCEKENLIKLSSKYLQLAKEVHANIEKIYTPSVDFKMVSEITQNIINYIK